MIGILLKLYTVIHSREVKINYFLINYDLLSATKESGKQYEEIYIRRDYALRYKQ